MADFPGYDSRKRNIEREQFEHDLATVLASPAGFRVICKILERLGLGNFLCANEGQIALHNEGERLLRDCMEADAGCAIRIMAAMRGVDIQ